MKKESIDSSFDDWLREEGTYEETSATAIKHVLARRTSREVAEQKPSKSGRGK